MDKGHILPINGLRENQKAASPAISTVIITAVTIVLVLVAGTYAYQTLDRQKGATEFETVQKSVTSLDDAIRDVAWERDSARSTRFTLNYGFLRLTPSTMPLRVNVTGFSSVGYSTVTGYVQYSLSTAYLTYGDQYEYYFIGNERLLSTNSNDSLARASINQISDWVNITLSYRVRALQVYTVPINQSGSIVQVSYVDIWIIKLNLANSLTYVRDFDLSAKTTNLQTFTNAGTDGRGYLTPSNKQCTINVQIGSSSGSESIHIDGERVVFNFIVSEIRLSGS